MALDDLSLAIRCARAGGDRALEFFRGPLRVEHKNSAADPVTEADRASEGVIVECLRAHRPDDGLVGEEGASVAGERVWLIDPVDGTLGFVAEQATWCTAVCLMAGGQPIVSAVYDPVAGELFSAGRTRGAHLNGRAISPQPRDLADAVVRIWCDREVAAYEEFIPALGALAGSAAALQAGSGGSLALAAVAAGRIHGWVELYPDDARKDWDWWPGALLITEAGGRADQLAGTRWRIAASDARLHDQIAECLLASVPSNSSR